jgi:hypothetical protein
MQRDGASLIVTAIGFDRATVEQIAKRLLPASLSILLGSITLFTTASDDQGGLETFLGISTNKLFDIYLFLLLRTGYGRGLFNIYVGAQNDAGYEAPIREQYYWKVCGSILLELVFHGSLSRLYFKVPGVTELLSKALDIMPIQFSMSLLCSIPNFYKVRMTELVVSFKVLLPMFVDEVRSRVRKGVAGNRIWVFLKWFASVMQDVSSLPEVIQYMMQPHILQGAPYISCHPMHPRNPFKDSADYLKAYIGHVMVQKKIQMPAATGKTKNILTKWFTDPFEQNLAFASGKLPVLEDMIDATSDDYSLANV